MPLNKAEFRTLPAEQQALLQKVCDNLHGPEQHDLAALADCKDEYDEFAEEIFDLLAPCENCVPDGYADGDLLLAIARKYRAIIRPGVNLACDAMGLRHYDMYTVVEASYDDRTKAVVIDIDDNHCYYVEESSAWNFEFETLAAICEAVLAVRDGVLQAYKERHDEHDGRSPEAPKKEPGR